jgi:hypothetical protein
MHAFSAAATLTLALGISTGTAQNAPTAVGGTAPDHSARTDDGHQVVRLWPEGAPGSEGWTQQEAMFGNPGARGVRNVVDPTISVFLPDPGTATGAGVIIAPGGGFRFLQWDIRRMDSGEQASGDSHLPAGRPRLRHAAPKSAGRHVARAVRRLAPLTEAGELTCQHSG